ncbi:hypothetical protein GBA63_05445 [Rubrobacter tropicus]|uniref:Uncharacterized protein n=1 Tax=Rubrobacter tropicus TaxID=2653851 RepID=A0A6G8Q6P5_9ACTN|nr:hypothetical protein [Rubrobacter tropicus]QIN82151.1 hypothetical protein GBA63_05445 [Rubrobacter tropicus]
MTVTITADDRIATLTWLAEALEGARAQGETGVFRYLEAVFEDVVFEMESASRSARRIAANARQAV